MKRANGLLVLLLCLLFSSTSYGQWTEAVASAELDALIFEAETIEAQINAALVSDTLSCPPNSPYADLHNSSESATANLLTCIRDALVLLDVWEARRDDPNDTNWYANANYSFALIGLSLGNYQTAIDNEATVDQLADGVDRLIDNSEYQLDQIENYVAFIHWYFTDPDDVAMLAGLLDDIDALQFQLRIIQEQWEFLPHDLAMHDLHEIGMQEILTLGGEYISIQAQVDAIVEADGTLWPWWGVFMPFINADDVVHPYSPNH